jgi:hypothetical protein
MFQPPPTNPMLNEGISMNIGTQQETTSELDPEKQTPSFSTQVGLDDIVVGDEEEHTTQRKPRERWSEEEDKNVIKSWLNISKDALVGVNQRPNSLQKNWIFLRTGGYSY